MGLPALLDGRTFSCQLTEAGSEHDMVLVDADPAAMCSRRLVSTARPGN